MTKSSEYIDWIDGAKGIAIVSVILLHSLPCLREIGWMWHIGQAVPVFLFITAYLMSLRFESLRTSFTWERLKKMLMNVFVPFLVVLFVQLICLALDRHCPSVKTLIKNGGIGPGAYYPWLYLQVWIIVPFIVLLVRKLPIWASALILLIISIAAEYLFVLLQEIEHINDLYQLLPIRYLIVLYIGCIWSILKEKQKCFFYGLACISALLILKDVYCAEYQIFANTPPLIITPPFWEGYHWYTAFYVVLPVTLLERIRYAEIWKQAGKYSWYIFLLQMMCFSFY